MKEIICTQCGYPANLSSIRCPRCNALLLKPCKGNCSRCRSECSKSAYTGKPV